MGDRLANLRVAVDALGEILDNIKVSRVYDSKALLPAYATPDMDMPFLNMVVSGQSDMPPIELLKALKAMEKSLGRIERRVWGPREIDIDIIAIGDLVLDTPDLTIPHREMLKRDFVMLPLADVAPGWCYPAPGAYQGKKVADIVTQLGYACSENLRDTGQSVHA